MFAVQTALGTQLSFGCPTSNFEQLPKRQPHYLDVNHCAEALAFSADFQYKFSIKMFLTKYYISWPISCIRPNFLTKITNSVFSNSFLANHWRDKLYNLALLSSPALTDKSKKRGEDNAENYVN